MVDMAGDTLLPHNHILKYSRKKRMVMTVKRWDFIKDRRMCEREGRMGK